MIPKLRARWSSAVVALVVAITTVAIVSNAVQSISIPNISYVTYSLAPGADSADITVPVSNSPVLLIADCTTVGRRGLAQLTLHRTSVAPLFLQWLGLGSSAAPVIESNWWPGGGTAHMAWLDFGNQVQLRVTTASQFDIQSLIPAGGPTATGALKLIW